MRLSQKLLVAMMAVGMGTNALAQDRPDQEIGGLSEFSGLPFDLLPPGARSLGLAGAFAGVADDATAAVANPAGLTILSAKEVSIHVRSADSDIDFLDPDAYDSTLFAGTPGRLNKQYSDSSTDVSFASFVLPFDRWVLSAYYSNQLTFASDQVGGPDIVNDSVFIDTYLNENFIDASLEGFGASAAFRVTDRFSVGLTLQNSELDMVSNDVWQVDDFNDFEFEFASDPAIGGNGTPEEYAAAIIDEAVASTLIDDSDSDTTFNVGLLFQASSSWSFGLVYREGAEFDVDTLSLVTQTFNCTGSGATTDDCNTVFDAIDLKGTTELSRETGSTTIKVPDTLTFGVGWRPSDTLLVSFDIADVGYSDSTQVRTITQGFGLDINEFEQISEDIDDGTQFHLGVEKVFVRANNNTFTIRGGAFTVEDHDGIANVDTDDTVLTVGLGGTFGSQGQFQLDLGASFGDQSDNIIFSGIYRF